MNSQIRKVPDVVSIRKWQLLIVQKLISLKLGSHITDEACLTPMVVSEVKALAVWQASDIVRSDDSRAFNSSDMFQDGTTECGLEDFDDGIGPNLICLSGEWTTVVDCIYEEVGWISRRRNDVEAVDRNASRVFEVRHVEVRDDRSGWVVCGEII